MAESIGVVIGFLFVAVWLPMAGWQVGRASGDMLIEWFTRDKDHRKPTPQKDPIPTRERRPKKLYTLDETKTLLGCGEGQIKRYILEEKIRTFADEGELYLHGADVKKLIPKPSKRPYPTLATFREEHRIINPVEFNT